MTESRKTMRDLGRVACLDVERVAKASWHKEKLFSFENKVKRSRRVRPTRKDNPSIAMIQQFSVAIEGFIQARRIHGREMCMLFIQGRECLETGRPNTNVCRIGLAALKHRWKINSWRTFLLFRINLHHETIEFLEPWLQRQLQRQLWQNGCQSIEYISR